MWFLLLGCIATSSHTLRSQDLGDSQVHGDLYVEADVELHNVPHKGWDLHANVSFQNRGDGNPRVDLSRAKVRADHVLWEPCRAPEGTDPETLLIVLQPRETREVELVCTDIRRPYDTLQVRMTATGWGPGSLEMAFDGVPR